MHASDAKALAELRRARRARRLADFDVGEAVYRAYIFLIVGGVAVWLASGLVGDGRLDPAGVARVASQGPADLGLAIAVALAVGARSGGRGGPVVIEAADVRHVLLAPVDRRAALRAPALRQLRSVFGLAVAVGACGGLLAFRRLPGPAIEWVAAGALCVGAAGVAGFGVALVVSGRRLGPRVANLIALALVGWAVADVAAGTLTSPAGLLASAALWPLKFRAVGLVGPVLAVVVVVAGLAGMGATSIEAAERRASLIGQIRFAGTVRDLRTVVVLRRQLVQEASRRRPWLPLRARRAHRPGWRAPWRRAVQGLNRFPAVRLVRMVAAGAIAGVSLVGVVHGTTPLLLVAAAALYVAALDAVEPLAQEADHPDRTESYDIDQGVLSVHLAGPSLVAMVLVALAGAVAAGIADGCVAAFEVGAVMAIPAAATATAGAALSVVGDAPKAYAASDSLLPPDMAGIRTIVRTALPPLVVVAGVAPALAARHPGAGVGAAAAVAGLEAPVLLLAVLVGAYVRYRARLAAWWSTLMEEAGSRR